MHPPPLRKVSRLRGRQCISSITQHMKIMSGKAAEAVDSDSAQLGIDLGSSTSFGDAGAKFDFVF